MDRRQSTNSAGRNFQSRERSFLASHNNCPTTNDPLTVSFWALPDIKTRVWPGRPPAEQQPASDDHYYYRHDGPTARGHRVKIACTSTPAILILVFANINDAGRLFAIKFHRPPAVVVSFPTIMMLRPQPPAGYWIPSYCTTKPKRERGVEKPYPTRAQLLTDRHFLELAQNLELALTVG
jgi:hypothetical protein